MKKLVILLLVIAVFPLISSAPIIPTSTNIHAYYQIISNKVLVEIQYEDVEGFTYSLPNNYNALEVSTENYELTDDLLTINDNSASFKFVTDDYTENSLRSNFFIMNNPFSQSADIIIYLEESSALPIENKIISPAPTQITGDGRRGVIVWNDFTKEEIVFNYETVAKTPFLTKLIILILVLILLTILIRYLLGKKKQKRKESTKNLYEDEKKIVEYLIDQKDKESWTKQMVRDLKISKVKLSRKLRSLEQKGLVKKVPYGNENRIILIK